MSAVADQNTTTLTFSAHFKQRADEKSTSDEKKSVQFNIVASKEHQDYVLMTADKKYTIKVFDDESVKDLVDKSEYWKAYVTPWNAFTSYTDFDNSNNASEVLGYFHIQIGTGVNEVVDGIPVVPADLDLGSPEVTKKYLKEMSTDFQKDAELLEDMIHAFITYMVTKGNNKYAGHRVSHLNYGVEGKIPRFEYVSRKPLKRDNAYVWRFF